MKNRKSSKAAVLAGVLALSLLAVARVYAVDLTQVASVHEEGTYTYFARGDAKASVDSNSGEVTPFKSMFYPQESKDGSLTWNCGYGSSSNAQPIAFLDGILTNRKNTRPVAGWQNVNELSSTIDATTLQIGSFDIVFDLGRPCEISDVTVTYSDAGGHRFSTASGAQAVYVSAKAPQRDSDVSLLGQATAVANASKSEMAFSGPKPVIAQYVIIRPMIVATRSSENPDAEAVGGYISSVAINGALVGKPSK